MVLLGAALAIPASANIDLIQNGDFTLGNGLGGTNNPGSYSGIKYDPSLSSYAGYCSSCSITDWTVTPSVDWIGTYWAAPNASGGPGGYSVDLDGLEQPGSISQTVTTVSGGTYSLSFYTNGNSDGPPNPKDLQVSVAGGTPSSKSYTPVPYVPANQSLTLWTHEVYDFTATGTSVTVTFTSLDAPAGLGTYPGTSFGPVVAGVSLTPEPGLYGVMAVGLVGLGLAVVRRRRDPVATQD